MTESPDFAPTESTRLTYAMRVLLRRWLWCVVALAIAMAGGLAAYTKIGPNQQSRAQVLLVPSLHQPGIQGASNPYLNLGPSLAVVASVIQVSLTDAHTQAVLARDGYTASYQVVPDLAENAGPILIIQVDDKSGTRTQDTMRAILAQVRLQLHNLQITQGVPKNLFITPVVLTMYAHPVPDRKSQIQIAVVVTVGLLLLSVTFILFADKTIAARRRRKELAGRPATRPLRMPWRKPTDTPHRPSRASSGVRTDPKVVSRTPADVRTGRSRTTRDDQARADGVSDAEYRLWAQPSLGQQRK